MVLAIVALLAGILLPVGCEGTNLVPCGALRSNLTCLAWRRRCIGTITEGGPSVSGRSGPMGDGDTGLDGFRDGAEGERAFDPTSGALWAYLPSRAVDTCPALNRCPARFKSKARGAAFGYAYNLLVGPRGMPGSCPCRWAPFATRDLHRRRPGQ